MNVNGVVSPGFKSYTNRYYKFRNQIPIAPRQHTELLGTLFDHTSRLLSRCAR